MFVGKLIFFLSLPLMENTEKCEEKKIDNRKTTRKKKGKKKKKNLI